LTIRTKSVQNLFPLLRQLLNKLLEPNAVATAQHELQQFLEFLKRRGMRVTTERLALCEGIFAQHGHIDVEELLASMHAAGSTISRATVYRNLELLVGCGLVRRQRLGQDRFRYEHVHAGQEHDHLICAECGRVVEFQSQGIVALQREICRAHGFDPGQHTLQIFGRCLDCVPATAAVSRREAIHA
jgi:Fur family transcriptional regulator, ferric uptake regulator